MATLTSNFLQSVTCNFYFPLIATFPCLLLTLDRKDENGLNTSAGVNQDKTVLSPGTHKACLSSLSRHSKGLSLQASTLAGSSFHEIAKNTSCDFFKEIESGNFVHVLELIGTNESDFDQLKTIQSDVLSLEGNDLVSTENSRMDEADEQDASQAEDI